MNVIVLGAGIVGAACAERAAGEGAELTECPIVAQCHPANAQRRLGCADSTVARSAS